MGARFAPDATKLDVFAVRRAWLRSGARLERTWMVLLQYASGSVNKVCVGAATAAEASIALLRPVSDLRLGRGDRLGLVARGTEGGNPEYYELLQNAMSLHARAEAADGKLSPTLLVNADKRRSIAELKQARRAAIAGAAALPSAHAD